MWSLLLEYAEIILSACLLLATISYTIINYLMLKENRAMREFKSKPEVIVYLKSSSDHSSIFFCVKNIGEGCATNVKLNIIGDDFDIFMKSPNSKKISDYPIFKEGISIFPSQQEYIYPLDWWSDKVDNGDILGQDKIKVSVSCQALSIKFDYETQFELSVSQIRTLYLNPPHDSVDRIAYYLGEIKKTIKKSI